MGRPLECQAAQGAIKCLTSKDLDDDPSGRQPPLQMVGSREEGDVAMSGAVERAWPREIEVQAPEPDLTADEIIRRAEALKPMVRGQSEESAQRGYHSEELFQEF